VTAGGAYVPTVFVGMYATLGRYNVRVSKLKHYSGFNSLHYMHNNPVKRALAKHPGDWPWCRRGGGGFYFWNDASILGMDKMP
jgi:hypothetical protein